MNVDSANLQRIQGHGLSRKNVSYLARSDSKSNRAKSSVSRGVRVPTSNCHSWLRNALLRTHDVHHALLTRVAIKESDSAFRTILSQFLDHRISERIRKRLIGLIRWDDVIDGGKCAVWEFYLHSQVT